MKLTRKKGRALLVIAAFAFAAPATAEVTRETDTSFVSRHEVVVAATPKEVWLALISPAEWWRSEHTWSGNSKNLTLMPQAGGCFCETIPEVDEPGRFTLEGSVEHMRVVQAYPEQALRMIGSLGPLQSEPVTGVLTVAISKTDKGTKIMWEYNVGGPMRYEIPVISKAVDGVMAAQLAALAKPLKVVAMPAPPKPPVPAAPATDPPPAGKPAVPPAAGTSPPAPVAAAKPQIKPAPTQATAPVSTPPAPVTTPKPAPKPAPKTPSVDDAFGDLNDPPKG